MSNSPLTNAVAALLGNQGTQPDYHPGASWGHEPDEPGVNPAFHRAIVVTEALPLFKKSLDAAGYVFFEPNIRHCLSAAYDALEDARAKHPGDSSLNALPLSAVAFDGFNQRMNECHYLPTIHREGVLVLAGQSIVEGQRIVLRAVERGVI